VGAVAVQQVLEEGLDRWNGPQGMAFSGVLRDITERKRAEAELAAANRELERANRPEGNRCLRRMADSTVYMQQLIHDLIDLSRVGRSGVEPIEVDLGRLVRAIAEDAGAANPAAEIRVGRLPVVTGDPVGFRQLFTNLLENAVRHAAGPTWSWWWRGSSAPTGCGAVGPRQRPRHPGRAPRARVRGL